MSFESTKSTKTRKSFNKFRLHFPGFLRLRSDRKPAVKSVGRSEFVWMSASAVDRRSRNQEIAEFPGIPKEFPIQCTRGPPNNPSCPSPPLTNLKKCNLSISQNGDLLMNERLLKDNQQFSRSSEMKTTFWQVQVDCTASSPVLRKQRPRTYFPLKGQKLQLCVQQSIVI